MHVPKPRKSSAEAAPSTVRKKARVMEEVRDRVSGGDPGVLLREELRRVPRDELRSMLHQLKFDQVVIPSGHQLEAKVKIGLNYNQLGKLRRKLKTIFCRQHKLHLQHSCTKNLTGIHSLNRVVCSVIAGLRCTTSQWRVSD